MRKLFILMCLLLMGNVDGTNAQFGDSLSHNPQRHLYLVATSHLDTQWRWTIKNTINEFIPATFRDNFTLMDIFPKYTFSFEGAYKYMLLKEYYPEEYERLKTYVARGRWRVAGSWVDPVDVNMPSPESLIRHVLYGNGYFKQEFGVTSRDILLPDCFGFGYSLPSIAAHCGLQSFSTQKLSWGSSVGVPFDIGMWEGVDGSSIIAALNPGAYVSEIREDLSRDTAWLKTIDHQGELSGVYAGFKYFGTGDTGGAPDSESVAWAERSMAGTGPITVSNIGSDDLADVIAGPQRKNLPRYKGELLMTRHGVGCYTSQAAMKRFNRKNELLIDAAERSAVIADWLGGFDYPRNTFKENWIRFLWHQFHDDLTGTSIPEAYEYSWNDEILCLKESAGILEAAVEATAPALDTRVQGVPLIVYNPLSISREDIVEATVVLGHDMPGAVRVYNPDGKEVPSQVTAICGDSISIVFLAAVPSVGYAVYDIRPTPKSCDTNTGLRVADGEMENGRYIVRINETGDLASIFDKTEQRELLSEPIRLQLLYDRPDRWAAWEIDYDEIMAGPQAVVGGDPELSIAERGPARVALKIDRRQGNSIFRQVVTLAAGEAGNRVEVASEIDWHERETLLKADFALTTANERVTYDLGLGTIERRLNRPELYEVPGNQWADMTAENGDYGIAILNDCKYGWDHPDKESLRLTLIHTPGVPDNWSWIKDQRSQDNGRHIIKYGIYGHFGDWRDGAVQWEAARLNQPLLAFQTTRHKGKLGKTFSMLRIHTGDSGKKSSSRQEFSPVAVKAVKLAENSDDIVIRLQELFGERIEHVQVQFAAPGVAVREINGAEETMGEIETTDGVIDVSLDPYQPRAFALTLDNKDKVVVHQPAYAPLTLPYNLDGISRDPDRRDGNFDGAGNTLSGDLLPDTLIYLGVPFVIGPTTAGHMNVLDCEGQSLSLPAGDYQQLCLVATAIGGPVSDTFTIADQKHTIQMHEYTDPRGKWNSRMAGGIFAENSQDITPAYINRSPAAWIGTHRHSADGENEAYVFTYLDFVELPLAPGVRSVILPNDRQIKILAATAVRSDREPVHAAQPLFDRANAVFARIEAERNSFLEEVPVHLACSFPGAEIRYTLDGSEPTIASPLYTGPIILAQTTTVKARAFREGSDNSHVTVRAFTRLVPRTPPMGAADKMLPGLLCSYYEGKWPKLPDFDTVAVRQSTVADSIAVPGFAREENYGLVFAGVVQIPRDGLYDFSVTSDDGSMLFIDDTLVADNDGLHGEYEVEGTLALKAGQYPLVVRMFQATGDGMLKVCWRGPGIAKQPIPAEMLFHAAWKAKK